MNMKIYRVLVWKYTGEKGFEEAEEAYNWLMRAPVLERPLRLWCIKHRFASYYAHVLLWIRNKYY